MPLKSLILNGFKSFADKTTIEFGNGITGIVGPNGSGKSNITEAIRWVMGESRAKSLRGQNMKDVIFAGSEFRKPMNHAEVTMIFDNRKRELAFDSDQVSITRRILRSGDNEYLINNKSVRQRDIRNLFMDSGLSQNSLSIISQGRVDQILNSQPKDRRVIFEEAAGVLHFKQQKHEAQMQLDGTNDNLIRINDLVKELENRVEPLHEQSSLAQEYQYEKSGLDADLKTLLAFEIKEFHDQLEKIQSSASKSKSILDKLDGEVNQSQRKLTARREEFENLNNKREELRKDVFNLTNQLSDINTQLQVTQQSSKFDEATKLEYNVQIKELNSSLISLKKELSDYSEQKELLTQKYNDLNVQKNSLENQLNMDPVKLNEELENKRTEYIQTLQDQTSSNNQLAYISTELKRTKEGQNFKENDVSNQLSKSKKELLALHDQGKELNQKRQQLQRKLQNLQDRFGNTQIQKQSLESNLKREYNQLQKVSARKDALINIQKRHDGYYTGVKNVLNHLDQFEGIVGVVGELITFPSKFESAMTTALGGGVQNLVALHRNDARNAIQKLKYNHGGRATFLPLDGLRTNSIPSSTLNTLESIDGFQGIASDLVSYTGKVDISSAIRYLLGTIIVVDNMDTAMIVSRRIGRYRVVTLDGDVISPGGAMTGGVRNHRNNSPLQTTAEINQLTATSEKLKQKVSTDQDEIDKLQEKLENLSSDIEGLNKNIQTVMQDLNASVLTYQNQEKEVKRLENVSRLYENQLQERKRQIESLSVELSAERQKQSNLLALGNKQKKEIADLQEKIRDFTSQNEDIQKKISELDPQIAVYKNKVENLNHSMKERLTQRGSIQSQLKKLQEKMDALEASGNLSKEKKNALNSKKESLSLEKNAKQVDLDRLSETLGQLSAQINKLETVASRNYSLRKNAASEQEQYSVQIATLKSQINQRLETLSNDYSLTYEAALNQAKVENTEENRKKLAKSVRLHKMSIEDIGPVNLSSIDEYAEVKDRYDFLNNQQDDLLKAREDLKKSMEELDVEVKDRFSETFEKIASSFSKIFPVVFGGGNAKLVLTDPDNLLETGIEIIAQPPGKKLQRLSLLSGGERSLTAITLLFAMLEVNPVPFCILDEVEAALDDANVLRFARFLKQYDMKTQFIVITHRRGTMEKADQLYGVVMQESGVSQVLSVSLKDLKEEVQ